MISLEPIIFGVFVFSAIKIYQFLFWRWKVEKMVASFEGPKGLPLIGVALDLMKADNFLDYNMRETKNFKSPIKFRMAHKLYVQIFDPQNARKVLNASGALDKADEYRFFGFNFSIFSIEKEKWKQHRKIINSLMFNKKFVESSHETISQKSEKLVKILDIFSDGSEFGVFNFVAATVVEMAFKIFFNLDYKALDNPEENEVILKSVKSTKVYAERMRNALVLYHQPIYMLSSLYQEERKSSLNKFYERLLKKKIEKNNELDFDSAEIGKFIDLILKPANKFKFFEARDNCKVLIFGAFDTTATMLSTALLLLGIHPKVQQKLFDEISDYFNKEVNGIDFEAIKKLKYLDLVCKETLRLFPPVPFLGRHASENIQLNENQTIPAGTNILINIFDIHRNPKFWGEDAHQFVPERFQPENSEKVDLKAFLPFSYGPRNCVGFLFADLFMKSILVQIVKKFEIKAERKLEDIEVEFSLTLKLKKTARISLRKR